MYPACMVLICLLAIHSFKKTGYKYLRHHVANKCTHQKNTHTDVNMKTKYMGIVCCRPYCIHAYINDCLVKKQSWDLITCNMITCNTITCNIYDYLWHNTHPASGTWNDVSVRPWTMNMNDCTRANTVGFLKYRK